MKNNQWQKTASNQTSEKVFIKLATNENKPKKEKTPATQTLPSFGRRFSIDDNGGSYLGL